MKNYQYRTELTEEERGDPFITAAFEVAMRAHANQPRYKLDPKIPYITHPLMVVDILYRMGVMDSRIIAAAILHDVLEDYKDYRNTAVQDAAPDGSMKKNHDRMHHDLMQELQKFVDQGWLTEHAAADGAAMIFALTKEVTKPVVYDEAEKLPAQIDKITHASFEGKIIKIADQAASLVCRLVAPDNANKFNREKQVETRRKAASLVGYILNSLEDPDEKKKIKPWRDFFQNVNVRTIQFDEGDKFVRRHIYATTDFEDFFATLKKPNLPAPRPKVIYPYLVPPVPMGSMLSPLLQVDVDSDMNVVQFVLRRGPRPDDPVYDVRRRLIEVEIPITNDMGFRSDPRHAVMGGTVRVLSDGAMVEGRVFSFAPQPMPLQAFMGTAYRAGACTIHQDRGTQQEIAKILNRASASLAMRDLWLARVRVLPASQGIAG